MQQLLLKMMALKRPYPLAMAMAMAMAMMRALVIMSSFTGAVAVVIEEPS